MWSALLSRRIPRRSSGLTRPNGSYFFIESLTIDQDAARTPDTGL
jgi:hypothetical protein